MKSKWYRYKQRAIRLRKNGLSIRFIENQLGIPRSTLSGWLKSIKLTSDQRKRLHEAWKNALTTNRKKAVQWHIDQKQKRLTLAKEEAKNILQTLDLKNTALIELGLSILYFCEGMKRWIGTGMGNSDPKILKFFLVALKTIHQIDVTKLRCELHLRADQNPSEMKQYWSRELDIPLSGFTTISIDKRTVGKPTYAYYKGVCVIRYGNAHIQRRLLFLGQMFLEKVIT